MPFVQRVVSPVHLSRPKLHNDRGRPIIDDQELEAISNHTLCFALKQLASVLKVATEIFQQLNGELDQVKDKSSSLKGRIAKLQVAVDNYDPKNVTVPVGDMTWFSELRNHYKAKQETTGDLFTAASRPLAVDVLYRRAAQVAAAQGKAPSSPTPSLTVTPVLGRTRRRHARLSQVDIETRKPASLAGVRKWTSSEALGELTSDPDATLRINPTPDAVDHTLPSPEEQLNAIANKFPSEMIYVDVSGKSFDRMSCMRRSLVLRQPPARKRRTRRQRRNTIATTDPKEIHQAASESTETVVGKSWAEMAEKKSQLEALKEWGLGRLRSLRPINKPIRIIDTKTAVTMRLAAGRKLATEPHSSSGNWSASSESGHSTTTTHHPRSSISSGSTCLKQRRPVTASTSSSVTSESSTVTPENDFETGSMYSCDTEGYYTSFHLDSGLKPLREEEPIAALSSTSILSGSTLSQGLTAESEYELFGRGSTSTTASSAGTVCTALPAPPPRRDSHLSGNRTFPERSRPLRAQTHSLRPADFAQSDHVDHLTRENLYKHNDDRCTISADIHRERPEKCGDSPDSGHNTCSSPVDSVASPSLDVVSECSDLEGVDRVERLREKTTINSSRIPSMCVITPPQSDDETSLKLDLSIDSGEYVTIAQVQQNIPEIRPSEFVSLNALPNESSLERRRHGARVTLDSEGKVIYASDSLRRKKSVHTTGTFEPGPCVVNNNSPIMPRVANIRPVQIRSPITVQKNTVQTKTLNTDNRQALLKKETNIQNDIGRNMVPHSPVKISNEKQYFPKSAYERENPCKSVRPLSPLAKQPNPSIKSPVMSPKTVVKAGSPTRSLSPIVSRGAYVRIQQPSDDLSFSCVSTGVIEPTSHAAVKRSDSYRLANQDTVFNPNSLGRRQYGPGVIASPTLLTALHEAQTIPAAPKEDVERTATKLLQTAIDSPTRTTPALQTHIDGTRSSARVVETNLDSPCSPSKVLQTHFDNLRLSTTNSVQTNSGGPRTPTKVLQTHFDGLRSSTNVVHSNLDSPRTPTSAAQMSFDFAKASGRIPQRGLSNPSSPSGISNQGTSTPKTLNFASPIKTTVNSSSSPLTSTPTKNIMSPLDFSTIPSPIEKSPPKNGRSAMDLFAIIHDSKKRIQALQQKGSQINWPKSIPAKIKVDNRVPPQNYNSLKQPSKTVENKEPIQNGIMKHMPKPMSPLTDLNTQKYTRHNNSYNSLPRMKIQNYEESPKNLVQRKVYGRQSQTSGNSKSGPTSTKDFKRLLLQTGTGTTGFVKESAVDRLKNRNLMSQPIQHNVLSTTIPEDCEGDEEVKSPVMMSASLVNKQIKAFEARASPTLETSL